MAKSNKPNPAKIKWICRAKAFSFEQVTTVKFEPDDIILAVRGLGTVRIERSALPASIEALPDVVEVAEPAPVRAVVQSAPGQKRAVAPVLSEATGKVKKRGQK